MVLGRTKTSGFSRFEPGDLGSEQKRLHPNQNVPSLSQVSIKAVRHMPGVDGAGIQHTK